MWTSLYSELQSLSLIISSLVTAILLIMTYNIIFFPKPNIWSFDWMLSIVFNIYESIFTTKTWDLQYIRICWIYVLVQWNFFRTWRGVLDYFLLNMLKKKKKEVWFKIQTPINNLWSIFFFNSHAIWRKCLKLTSEYIICTLKIIYIINRKYYILH